MTNQKIILITAAVVVGFVINYFLLAITATIKINGPVDNLCYGYNNSELAPIIKMELRGGAPIQPVAINIEKRGNCLSDEEFKGLTTVNSIKGEYLTDLMTQSFVFYINWLIWTGFVVSLIVMGRKLYANNRR